MKNASIFFALFCSLYWVACQETIKPPSEAAKSLRFVIDHEQKAPENQYDLTAFANLFTAKNNLRTDNFEILKDGKQQYYFDQSLGDVSLRYLGNEQYELLEHYILPVGSVYGKIALFRYELDLIKGSLVRDVNFEPQLAIYRYWSNHVVKEYDRYLQDSSFTTTNFDEVPHVAYNTIKFLMFNLTLATILEDCQACREKLVSIETDYPLVNSSDSYQQNLQVCREILKRYEQKTCF